MNRSHLFRSKRFFALGGVLISFGMLGIPFMWRGGARVSGQSELFVLPVASVSSSEFSSNEPIKPVPDILQADKRLVALGRRLFADRSLSGNGKVACSTCHILSLGGADQQVHSRGINGVEGRVNTPTVLNAALNFTQFWDGRVTTLEEQAVQPIENPIEMGSDLRRVTAELNASKAYRDAFQEIFFRPITRSDIAAALAAYERSLLTPNAPFDLYLKGDKSAISPQAAEGYQRFKSFGCVACHQGRNVGGNMFQRFGVIGDYFADRGHVTDADFGRFNVTHREEDRYVFKVPSLRNVALTAPYFHDGSAQTLDSAVRIMARYQLGRVLSDTEAASLVSFLETLTGELPQ